MGNNDRVPKLQRVIKELPAGFDALRAEARAEGYLFVERLATDWMSGTTGSIVSPPIPGAIEAHRARHRIDREPFHKQIAFGARLLPQGIEARGQLFDHTLKLRHPIVTPHLPSSLFTPVYR